MMLSLAPTDAGAAERTFVALECVDLDAAADEELSPLPREADLLAAPLQHARRDPALEQTHGDLP
jgi:hypothetical protein